MPTVCEIVTALFLRAPRELAHDDDNVGLQVGDPAAEVRRVVVALDATRSVMQRAEECDAQAIVAHHPLIFSPVRSLDLGSYVPSLAAQAVRAGISVVSMHTNLDSAAGGVNDRLAEVIGLRSVRPLRPHGRGALTKVVTFVPVGDAQRVRQAMSGAGAGELGSYRECSFSASGTGTFRPLSGARPTIGRAGELQEVEEVRLEMLVSRARLSDVLRAMLAAHPYEEAAYDVISLENDFPGAGDGRLGELTTPVCVRTLARRAARSLNAAPIRVTGDPERTANVVAVLGGSARGYVERAHQAGADALLAGEIPHHERLEAEDRGLAVVELGHAPSELPAVWVLADWLRDAFGAGLEVIAHERVGMAKEGAE